MLKIFAFSDLEQYSAHLIYQNLAKYTTENKIQPKIATTKIRTLVNS